MKLPAASCGVSKRNCVEAKPAFALICYGAVRHAIHTCSKLQGILAEANKKPQLEDFFHDLIGGNPMKSKKRVLLIGVLSVAISVTLTHLAFTWPTVYPRGLTICKIDRVEPGYILLTPNAPGRGAILIDNLTGNIIKEWKYGGKPTKLLSNGNIFLNEKEFVPGLAGNYAGDLTEFNWDGKKFGNGRVRFRAGNLS